jgi:hypothetical protein
MIFRHGNLRLVRSTEFPAEGGARQSLADRFQTRLALDLPKGAAGGRATLWEAWQ